MRRILAAAVFAALVGGVAGRAQERTPSLGSERAGTAIEVFLSFESEPSARASVVLKALLARHTDAVRIVFRHLPREADAAALLAHRAALAAGEQAQFWEMADLLMANQGRHTRADLVAMARQLHLDTAQFEANLNSQAFARVLAADRARAIEAGVTDAPAYVVNGTTVTTFQALGDLERAIGKR